jgi:hypothetical protein
MLPIVPPISTKNGNTSSSAAVSSCIDRAPVSAGATVGLNQAWIAI